MFKPRKRLLKPHLHKKNVAKELVETGKARITKKSKREIPEKIFRAQSICKCMRQCCTKIDVLQQKKIFDNYYYSMRWSQKTLFLRENIKMKKVETKRSAFLPIFDAKNRNLTGEYSFVDENGVKQQVCRHFFMNCLQVTPSRIYSALKTLKNNPGANELRGAHPSYRKTNPEDVEAVKGFIRAIPCYESHYGRSSSKKKYLSPELNVIKLYREYRNLIEFKNQTNIRKDKVLSEYMFRHIFNTQFNLAFKRRKTDTCKVCDEYENRFRSSVVPPQAKNDIKKQKEIHLELVKATVENFKKNVENALNSEGQITILTFDLQKTLATPSIETNVTYYKRQLWTYNLCIYDEIHKKGIWEFFL